MRSAVESSWRWLSLCLLAAACGKVLGADFDGAHVATDASTSDAASSGGVGGSGGSGGSGAAGSGGSGAAGVGGAATGGAAGAGGGNDAGGAGADALAPGCGNGVREPPEACDGADLGNATCASLIGSAASGTLSCSKYCQLVTAQCTPQGAFGNMSALQAGAAWPMHFHDPHLTARSPVGAPSSLKIAWTLPVPQGVVWGTVIDKDGVVYFGSGNSLYAIYPDGSEKWKYDAGVTVASVPLIRADGSIVFGAWDGYVYVVSASGAFVWSAQVAVGRAAQRVAIAGDGTIYATTDKGEIVALSPSGSEKWRYAFAAEGDWIGGQTPAVADDGTIYVSPSWSNAGVTALGPNGTFKWVYAPPGAEGTVHTSIDASGAVLVRWKKDNPLVARLVALAPDKTEKWSIDPTYPVSEVGIAADGTLFHCAAVWYAPPPHIVATKPGSASPLWSMPGSNPHGAGVVLGADGAALSTLEGAGIQLLEPLTGATVAYETLPGDWVNLSAISIAANGRVYMASSAGLHAFGP